MTKTKAHSTSTEEVRPGYKFTQLGWMPEDWEIGFIGEFYEFKNGLNKGKEFFGQGTPIINYKDVYQHTVLHRNDIEGKVTVSESEKKRYSTKRGDIFFTRTSETIDEIGITAVLLEDIKEAVFSGFVLRARPKKKRIIYPEFAGFCFNTFNARKEIIRKSTYTTRALTNGSFLSEVMFILPDYEEQKQIAQCLTTWDRVITKLATLIKAKQRYKKALTQRLLTGKKRLPGFEGEWVRCTIGSIAEEFSMKNEHNEDIKVLSCTKYDGLVPSLEYFGRQVFGDNLSNYKIVPRGYYAYATNHIEEGSIGYQNITGVGLVSPMYTVFKTSDSINDDFFFRVLKSYRLIHEYNRYMEGSINRRGGLRWKKFKHIEVIIPDYEEQKAIADVLSAADQEIELLQKKLDLFQEQKKGMMQQLLTGKKRLN